MYLKHALFIMPLLMTLLEIPDIKAKTEEKSEGTVPTKAPKPKTKKYYTDINTAQEYAAITQSRKPNIIKYYAPWCQACDQMEPAFNKAAEKYSDQITFYRVNIDNKQLTYLSKKHKILGLPTTIFSKDKEEKKRERGSIIDENELNRSIEKFIASYSKPTQTSKIEKKEEPTTIKKQIFRPRKTRKILDK
jgi:thiol-disulfide isomerase/thioredoxin